MENVETICNLLSFLSVDNVGQESRVSLSLLRRLQGVQKMAKLKYSTFLNVERRRFEIFGTPNYIAIQMKLEFNSVSL